MLDVRHTMLSVITFQSCHTCEINIFHFVPILQVRKLRPREVSEATEHVKELPVQAAPTFSV